MNEQNALTPEEIEAIRASNPKWASHLAQNFATQFAQAVATAQLNKATQAIDPS